MAGFLDDGDDGVDNEVLEYIKEITNRRDRGDNANWDNIGEARRGEILNIWGGFNLNRVLDNIPYQFSIENLEENVPLRASGARLLGQRNPTLQEFHAGERLDLDNAFTALVQETRDDADAADAAAAAAAAGGGRQKRKSKKRKSKKRKSKKRKSKKRKSKTRRRGR